LQKLAILLFACFAVSSFALQLGEVSADESDSFADIGDEPTDRLTKLVADANSAPIENFPKLLEEARAIAAQLTDAGKQQLLSVFVTMRVRVTEVVETLTKEVEDTKVIIRARISEKEIQISKLRDEMLSVQRKYEEEQAARLKEIETIKRVKALLIQIMNSIIDVKVTKESSTVTEKGKTTETNESNQSVHVQSDGKTTTSSSSSASATTVTSEHASSEQHASSSQTLSSGSSSVVVTASSSSEAAAPAPAPAPATPTAAAPKTTETTTSTVKESTNTTTTKDSASSASTEQVTHNATETSTSNSTTATSGGSVSSGHTVLLN